MLRRTALTLIVVILTNAMWPQQAFAHGQHIEILVGQDGFEHSTNFLVEVEAGHEVTITFAYADGDLDLDNPHEIKIIGAGIDLPTVIVSRDHPTATLTFTPNESGTFTILCIIPCIGMERLVGGTIRVVPPREMGIATSLSMELSPLETGAIARAVLVDTQGDPVGNVPIRFVVHTSVGGELEVGAPQTMEDGSVAQLIPAAAPGQSLRVTALFDGGNGFGFSQHESTMTMPGLPPAVPLGALSAPTPPPVLALILLIVLASIWAMYGLVVYQVWRFREE